MIKKRETCLYCGEKMESKTAKKLFCSPLHKLYWHREFKRGTLEDHQIEEKKHYKKEHPVSTPSKEVFNEFSKILEKTHKEKVYDTVNSTRVNKTPPAELKGIDLRIWEEENL